MAAARKVSNSIEFTLLSFREYRSGRTVGGPNMTPEETILEALERPKAIPSRHGGVPTYAAIAALDALVKGAGRTPRAVCDPGRLGRSRRGERSRSVVLLRDEDSRRRPVRRRSPRIRTRARPRSGPDPHLRRPLRYSGGSAGRGPARKFRLRSPSARTGKLTRLAGQGSPEPRPLPAKARTGCTCPDKPARP